MIRTFIAVDLPEEVRQELATLQADFKKEVADIKWVEPDNLHLTLKFLGDVEEGQIEALKQSLTETVRGSSPFSIHLEGIGAFPRTTSPRVIWVGVSEGKEQLIKLAGAIDEACIPFTLSPSKGERPFSPHLTIGRVRSRDGLDRLIKKLQVVEFRASTPAPIDRLILYQSTLSPKGPTYTPLVEFPLG